MTNGSLRYLVIEGNIGAGKTSLVKKIAAGYNARMILERFAENPFLPKFYAQPERFSFPLELSFLADRYHQLKEELASPDLFHPFIVADYYFMKSLIFSRQTLNSDEFNLYRQLFDIVYHSVPKPDLFVYLSMSTERLLNQIKRRNREFEKTITADYLNKIQESYLEFIKQQTGFPVLLIDANSLDYINNETHYQIITDAIFGKTYQPGTTSVIL
jgi:deoxyguanosine kinase